MSDSIHVENIRTGMVHDGRLNYGYRRRPDFYTAVCGGRSDSMYRLTDAPITCKRCLRMTAQP